MCCRPTARKQNCEWSARFRIFAAIAAELGGDRVETESIIQGTEDPHFVDPKPSHILRVNRADLLICIGLGLESGWLPVLLTQARNPNVQVGAPGYLDASQFVTGEGRAGEG